MYVWLPGLSWSLALRKRRSCNAEVPTSWTGVCPFPLLLTSLTGLVRGVIPSPRPARVNSATPPAQFGSSGCLRWGSAAHKFAAGVQASLLCCTCILLRTFIESRKQKGRVGPGTTREMATTLAKRGALPQYGPVVTTSKHEVTFDSSLTRVSERRRRQQAVAPPVRPQSRQGCIDPA
jgi:hypothetical protein